MNFEILKMITLMTAVIFCISASVFADEPASAAPSNRPRIAVYVTGTENEAMSRSLGTFVLNAIAKTNRYTPIERSEAFLAEIASEQIKQRSGAIDDSQISRLGMQAGVQFICVADVASAQGDFHLSIRILDVETAEVVAVSVSPTMPRTKDNLRIAAEEVVETILKRLYPEDYFEETVQRKRFRFGGRAGYNSSFVSGLSLTVVDFGPHTDERKSHEPHDSKFGFAGSGFELSAVVKIAITDDAVFSLSPGFVMRSPYATDAAKISELAVSIPALFEWRLFNSPVSAVGGVQMDIPFNTEILWADEDESEPLDEIRPSQDFGLVLGVSVQVMYNLAVDMRFCAGISEFDKENSHFLRQLSVGVSYLY